MGISIHYSGKFNKGKALQELITEVKEIVEVLKWKYNIYEETFPHNQCENQSYDGKVYGISFTPPESETVSICFLSNFRMSSPVHLKVWGSTTTQEDGKYLYMLSSKTQYAGTYVHKTIIEIFCHLNKNGYFSDFELIDEGKYWETKDEKLLEEKFKFNADLIDNFSLAVESIPMKQGETFENYFERILKRIDNRNKKRDE